MNRVVMALSGGMDSTSLLLRMLARGSEVTCISYDYGQKHIVELDRATANIDYLRTKGYRVEHIVADLSSAMSLFDSSITDSERSVPEGHYEEEQMMQTVVPNRNAIFSSILYGYALSVSTKENVDVSVTLGVHSGDHAIYPDCRPEFYDALMRAFENWELGLRENHYQSSICRRRQREHPQRCHDFLRYPKTRFRYGIQQHKHFIQSR